MPTVFVERGFRFFFYANEGDEPPHVHVEKGDGRAKLWLEPVELAWKDGLTPRDVRAIRIIVHARREEIIACWRKFFES
jgi:hypothetical protein